MIDDFNMATQKVFFVFLLTFATAVVPASHTYGVRVYYNTANSDNHTVFVRKSSSAYEYAYAGVADTWDEANRTCQSLGSHLVKLDEEDDVNYVLHEIIENATDVQVTRQSFYLGLTHDRWSHFWRWTVDKEKELHWENREGEEPKHVPEHERRCAFSTRVNRWHTITCHAHFMTLHVVCQRRKTVHHSCDDKPCLHKGLCRNTGHGFRCECLDGLTGHRCELEIDECASHPCQNDGYCSDRCARYDCTCRSGFCGSQCEHVDYCVSSPCQNSGGCVNLQTGYSCQCLDIFTGTNCESLLQRNDQPIIVEQPQDNVPETKIEQTNPLTKERIEVTNGVENQEIIGDGVPSSSGELLQPIYCIIFAWSIGQFCY